MSPALLLVALVGCDAEPVGPDFDCPPDIASLLARIVGEPPEADAGTAVTLTCGTQDGLRVPLTAKSDRYTASGALTLDAEGRVVALTMSGATGGLDQRYTYRDGAFAAMIDCVGGQPAKVMSARGGPDGWGSQLWMGRGGELSLVSAELWEGGKVKQLVAAHSGEAKAANATSWEADGRAKSFDTTTRVAPAAPLPTADPVWSTACTVGG